MLALILITAFLSPARGQTIAERVHQAAQYSAEKHYPEIVQLLNPYTDQLSTEGFLLLADAYSKQQDFVDEVRVLKILCTKDDGKYQWHMLLAQADLKKARITTDEEAKREDETSAIQEYRRVLRQSPKFRPAYDELLATLLRQKANNDAREMLIEGIEKFGKRPELLRQLCRLDTVDGFLNQAETNCLTAIKLEPNYPDSYVYLIQALHDLKKEPLAERNAVYAAKKFPRSDFVQWGAGMLFFKAPNYPVAARYFSASLKVAPDSERAAFGLARALFESGHTREALPYFVKACRKDQSTLDKFFAAGERISQKGDTILGHKYDEAARSCNPVP